jgi:hypothetical protein
MPANPAARRPSSPTQQPPGPAASANPAAATRGTSGPKVPVARPLMGGSPFPSATAASQRASGPKPAMPPMPGPNGTDPSKKP